MKRSKKKIGGFPLSIELMVCGFLFWFIIVTNLLSERFGYIQMNELESDAKLQKIGEDPKKFKIGVVLILIEHGSIIALAVMLFIAFNPCNLILGIVWVASRTIEGGIQIYDKKNYWGLLDLARQYSGASGAEKKELIESGQSILETKKSTFTVAQLFFSIGTFTYSILFVTYIVDMLWIGVFGLVASMIYGVGNGIHFVKPDFKALWNLGGLLILLFEIVLGGWLLFFS